MRLTFQYQSSIRRVAIVFTILFSAAAVFSQSSSFAYQGRLTDGGTAANGNYDFQFALWDSLSGGTQIGSTQSINVVAVSNGVFTVSLDFGANPFSGANRFLEISVRPFGSGSFTTLSPRQQISSTPYAIRTLSAASADTATTATNATQLGGIAASQYVQTSDSRLFDSRSPAAGSTNYIQNTSSAQAANFNIGGNGTVAGNLVAGGNLGVNTSSFLRPLSLQLGPNTNAAFTVSPSDGTPNAGYLRFGDQTGWKLHFARSRESSGGALNAGTTGALLTIQDNGNVGLSNTNPTFRLHVIDLANTGLRVQTNTAGGTVASFGGNGDFQIDAVNNVGGRLTVKENGNVGIGLPVNGTPQARLDIRGDVKLGTTGQLFAPGGEENLRIIRGFFDEGGNVNAGKGFTVSTSPSLLGTYVVTFTTPFSGVPTVTASCLDVGGGVGHACIASIFSIKANQVTIDVFDDGGNSVDSQVLFIAIGPR